MKRFLIPLVGLIAVVGTYLAWDYLALSSPGLKPGEVREAPADKGEQSSTANGPVSGEIAPDTSDDEEDLPASVPFVVEEVVSGLEVPWSIVFTSPERMLVTERPGRLRIVQAGELLDEPLYQFDDVAVRGESGLMGMTLHPEYEENRLIYLCLTYRLGGEYFLRILRFRDEGDRLTDETTIIEGIRAASNHAGSQLAFGPDGKLYITTGDALERDLAQETDSLAGKILRINADGSIPEDNPFPGSPVWSYGHRNPQGLNWHPESGEMYASEHGPSVFDGPAGGDEINRIVRGGNYGWPLVSHERTAEGTIAPIALFTPAEAPASLLIYRGTTLPQFRGNQFFGALRGQGLVRLVLDPDDPDEIVRTEKLAEVQFGRIRPVVEGPDGAIYFATSNRDGRGDPAANDDRVFRIRAE